MKVQIWYYISVQKGDDLMSYLKELRISKKLTQAQACALIGISLRSYKSYENDESKFNGSEKTPLLN